MEHGTFFLGTNGTILSFLWLNTVQTSAYLHINTSQVLNQLNSNIIVFVPFVLISTFLNFSALKYIEQTEH